MIRKRDKGWRKERVEISRLRHQSSSYSPFCLLVLRLTLRIQTQGRSAEERESQGLYKQAMMWRGQVGKQSKQLHSSLAGGNCSFFLKRKAGKSFILPVILSSLECICFVIPFGIRCLFMQKKFNLSLLSLFLYFLIMCVCDSDHLQWGTIKALFNYMNKLKLVILENACKIYFSIYNIDI